VSRPTTVIFSTKREKEKKEKRKMARENKSCLLTAGCYDTGSPYHTTSFRLCQPVLPSACRFDTSTSEETRSKSFPCLYDPIYPFVLSHQCKNQSNMGISFASSNLSKSSISAGTSCEFCRRTLRGFPLSRFFRSQRTRFGNCPFAWPK
jgi:hypothetical protein